MSTLIPRNTTSPALQNAVAIWADVSTDATSARRADLLRDKRAALLNDGSNGRPLGFFAWTGRAVEAVTPSDVQAWIAYLEAAGLSPATVYARVSRLSSFYEWLLGEPQFAARASGNPAKLARPKAPKAYQSESTSALSDEDVRALLEVVRRDARAGDVAALRDYAMLRFYFATGKRRAEIARLTWGDLKLNGTIIFTTRHKGGLYQATEINDPGTRAALVDYLKATGRWNVETDTPDLAADSPLWLRHDHAARPGQGVSSHGFVKALKGYAERARISDIHLHQTRHTVARMVGDESGNIADVQTILGHQNQATTRIYLQRVAVKRDKFSTGIAKRLGLDDEG